MRRAAKVCVGFGVGLALISVAATFAPRRVDTAKAKEVEDTMYQAKVASHDIDPDEKKRSQPAPAADADEAGADEAMPSDTAPENTVPEKAASDDAASEAAASDAKAGDGQASTEKAAGN
jgi:hypothetical protein